MMEELNELLGLNEGDKRIYRVVDGEVTQDEFEYARTLDALIFGDKGYVETLGPTWSLIHDPRFITIEDAFITNRRAVFNGDATTGKQYIASDGTFTSSIGDLEQYSELLGEGRYFLYILTHPNGDCPVRNWLLRIFPNSVRKEGTSVPVPNATLQCECDCEYLEPRGVKNWTDEQIWDFIKAECPNYFNQKNEPNGIAKRLFDLFRADLLGLIADFALTPLSDVYVELDTGDVLSENQLADTPNHVFLEVDILEKALTQRAVLRATAAKILRTKMDFQKTLHTIMGKDFRLTDFERDHILRMVYRPASVGGIELDPANNWYGFLSVVNRQIIEYLQGLSDSGISFEERQKQQLLQAKEAAQKTFRRLQTGELQSINNFTESEGEIVLDAHAEIMQEILKNPLKMELFMMYAAAEQRGEDEENDHTDRLNMRQLFSILTPIFSNADLVIGEEEYAEYMEHADRLGFFTKPMVSEVEEEYHG